MAPRPPSASAAPRSSRFAKEDVEKRIRDYEVFIDRLKKDLLEAMEVR
jgi:hypothetical protein